MKWLNTNSRNVEPNYPSVGRPTPQTLPPNMFISTGALPDAAQIMEKAFDWLDAPVARVSCKDVPLPYNRNLEFAALPSEEDVVEAVLRTFKE